MIRCAQSLPYGHEIAHSGAVITAYIWPAALHQNATGFQWHSRHNQWLANDVGYSCIFVLLGQSLWERNIGCQRLLINSDSKK